jgi:hypothetical protein
MNTGIWIASVNFSDWLEIKGALNHSWGGFRTPLYPRPTVPLSHPWVGCGMKNNIFRQIKQLFLKWQKNHDRLDPPQPRSVNLLDAPKLVTSNSCSCANSAFLCLDLDGTFWRMVIIATSTAIKNRDAMLSLSWHDTSIYWFRPNVFDNVLASTSVTCLLN